VAELHGGWWLMPPVQRMVPSIPPHHDISVSGYTRQSAVGLKFVQLKGNSYRFPAMDRFDSLQLVSRASTNASRVLPLGNYTYLLSSYACQPRNFDAFDPAAHNIPSPTEV